MDPLHPSLRSVAVLVTAVSILSLWGAARGEDLAYFEKVYRVKLPGIKAIEEYPDPDQFYTAIARKLGIPKLAFEAIEKKYGWKKDKALIHKTIVGRDERAGRWQVLVFQFTVDQETKKPLIASMQKKIVEIDDAGEVHFLKPEDEAKIK